MIIYPNAKINIGLNVVEKRQDGYHDIETVFYPIELLDVMEITDSKDYQIRVTGSVLEGSPEDNLVTRAFRMIETDFGIPAVSIHLHKHIPTGAGLGGGSSDAAFTIKALNERFSLGMTVEQMEWYASRIGADCAFFIQNRPVFATGIGNVFQPLNLSLKNKVIVLVKPDQYVSTPDAYRCVKPYSPKLHLPELLKEPLDTWNGKVINDFEYSVFQKYPEIAAIKDRLYDLGALYASMSGSGSTVYGLFDSPIENIDDIFSGYFVRQRAL